MWSHLQLLAGKPLALAGLHWWQRSREPATQSPCQLMHTGAGQLPRLPSPPSPPSSHANSPACSSACLTPGL